MTPSNPRVKSLRTKTRTSSPLLGQLTLTEREGAEEHSLFPSSASQEGHKLPTIICAYTYLPECLGTLPNSAAKRSAAPSAIDSDAVITISGDDRHEARQSGVSRLHCAGLKGGATGFAAMASGLFIPTSTSTSIAHGSATNQLMRSPRREKHDIRPARARAASGPLGC